jgi:hypothetical protein
MDVVLWWGSVHSSSSRGHIMSNAFNLLKPGGAFVLIDVYPTKPIPSAYVGGNESALLQYLSRAVDMNGDLEGWVKDQWIKAAGEIASPEVCSSLQIDAGRVTVALKDAHTEDDEKCEMKCLYFTKPRIPGPDGK